MKSCPPARPFRLPRFFTPVLLCAAFTVSALRSQAQAYECPPNIGFEYGNFSTWQTNTGNVTLSGTTNVINLPANGWLANSNSPGRQDLMDRSNTVPTTDKYGGFPVFAPGGGQFTLKLGSDANAGTCANNTPCPNALAEAARYIVQVPANAADASITFSYAVVLENPLDGANRHRDEEQPRFNVRMYDPVSREVIPCANFDFVASGPLPGFDTSAIKAREDAVIRFKPWSSVYVNLSKYPGRTFYLEFTTADCTKGGHFGYAYVDVLECGVAAKSLYRCAAPSRTTLIGPPGFETYQWYTANFATLLGTTQNLVLTPSPPLGTQFKVIAKPYANTGCPTCDCRDTVDVTVSVTYPDADAGEDTIACPGKPFNLSTEATPGYGYLWSPTANVTNPQSASTTATVSGPMPFVLTVTDTLGCSATDTMAVRIYDPITVTATAASVCANEPAQLNAQGAKTYAWSPAAGLNSSAIANPVANVSNSTAYTVIGTDSVNCYSDTATVTVAVKPSPSVTLGPDVTLPIGETLTLNSTVTNGPITRWQWTPAAGLSCTTCPEPTAEIKWDIAYRLTVRNEFNCTASDTITIKTVCPNSTVYVPNAFTPDGDGVNDVFFVQGKNIYVVKSFRIFNRWGELVFEKANIQPNNPALGWDGKIRGVAAAPDVFVYTVEVMCGGEKPTFFKGNVSVLK